MSALYRKHRPRDFDEFSPGQPHVVQTLRNAVEMDRVAHAYLFARPGLPEISAVLHRIARAESIEVEPAAVTMIARAAGGSFRDAVSALDQLATACPDAITVANVRDLLGTTDAEVLLRIVDLVADGDAAGCLRLVDEQ